MKYYLKGNYAVKYQCGNPLKVATAETIVRVITEEDTVKEEIKILVDEFVTNLKRMVNKL